MSRLEFLSGQQDMLADWGMDMKGYIIYQSSEAEKNKAFIEKLKAEGDNQGISFEYVPAEEHLEYAEPDIVINRTRDYRVSRHYENKGIAVFNPAYLVHIGNNKYEAAMYLSEHLTYEVKSNKWAANTWFVSKSDLPSLLDNEYLKRLVSNLAGDSCNDVVIKSVDGRGGREVFLLDNGASNTEKLKEILENLKGKDCVIQERIESNSSDIRVYILGGEIYAAVIRNGSNDFRSNYSLGGSASEYKLMESQKSYIKKFAEALGGSRIGMAGIDFIVTKDGNLVFNEIEEMAGSRMLYECTGYNIAADYVKWISRFV